MEVISTITEWGSPGFPRALDSTASHPTPTACPYGSLLLNGEETRTRLGHEPVQVSLSLLNNTAQHCSRSGAGNRNLFGRFRIKALAWSFPGSFLYGVQKAAFWLCRPVTKRKRGIPYNLDYLLKTIYNHNISIWCDTVQSYGVEL